MHIPTEGAGVIFDSDDKIDTSAIPEGVNLCPVPLSQLAKDAGGKEILINVVALGATTALLGGDMQILKNLAQE
ncbi:2-oxoacid:acceptor oxidoreductase family protein, partial [Patescibacteria group bacterium]